MNPSIFMDGSKQLSIQPCGTLLAAHASFDDRCSSRVDAAPLLPDRVPVPGERQQHADDGHGVFVVNDDTRKYGGVRV